MLRMHRVTYRLCFGSALINWYSLENTSEKDWFNLHVQVSVKSKKGVGVHVRGKGKVLGGEEGRDG